MKVLLNFAKKLGTDIKSRTSYSIDYLLGHRVENCLSVGGIIMRKAISPVLRVAYRHHKEAFDHIKHITPTIENAFVFRNKT